MSSNKQIEYLVIIHIQGLTRLASSLNGRHSPKAFKRVVIFFFGSGLDKAKIIGLWGFVRNRMICQRMLAMRQK
jgi:hypothetical protein